MVVQLSSKEIVIDVPVIVQLLKRRNRNVPVVVHLPMQKRKKKKVLEMFQMSTDFQANKRGRDVSKVVQLPMQKKGVEIFQM